MALVIIGALGGGMLKTELKTVFNDQEHVDKIAGGNAKYSVNGQQKYYS